MMTVFQILEAIEQTQGTNAKQLLLAQHADNDLLKKVFQLTSDPYVNFFISKIPKSKAKKDLEANVSDDTSLELLFLAIENCMQRICTGNKARDLIAHNLNNMSEFDYKWACRIITRKLRIGIGESGIEKIWPGLVPSFEVSLADKVDWEIKDEKLIILTSIHYPVRVEPKWDGFRCIAIKSNDEVTLFARSGRVFDRAPKIKKWLETHMPNDFVFDGEIMSRDWNDTAEILGSRVNHKDDESLCYFIFDVVPLDIWKVQGETGEYIDRLTTLFDLFENINLENSSVKPAQGLTIKNEKELLDYYELCLSQGFEGVMIKKFYSKYEFKRSENILKLKPVTDYDCVVCGVELAREQTKWDGLYTILRIRLPAGGIAETRVGTGTSDDEKNFINEQRERLIGRVCEVQGQPPLSADFRIRFPRFTRWREEWDCSPEVRKLVNEIKSSNS